MDSIVIEVKKIKRFDKGELEELTSATMNAIEEGDRVYYTSWW